MESATVANIPLFICFRFVSKNSMANIAPNASRTIWVLCPPNKMLTQHHAYKNKRKQRKYYSTRLTPESGISSVIFGV